MRNLRNSKGFTLIELMIVVVIIGILAAIAIPKFGQASARAKEKEADGILKQYYTLQSAYYAQNGAWAVTDTELREVGWENPTGLKHYTFAFPTVTAAATTWTASFACTGTGYNMRQINHLGQIADAGACVAP
jgi:prepilin-type N-terminal cleavage/methylation domain-containing protein